MRLPAETPEQKRHEASRQFCETLYQAFLDGHKVHVTATRETIKNTQARISANTRHFWASRGFAIRTKSSKQKTTLLVWLEKRETIQEAAA